MTVTVVLGLKGGVGTTESVAQLARVAVARERACIALDLDRWGGDLAERLGIAVPEGSVASLSTLEDGAEVGDAALAALSWRSKDGIDVIASPGQPELAELVEPQLVTRLIEAVPGNVPLVIDAGSRCDEVVFAACVAAWRIVLVGRRDAACERQAHVLVELLRRASVAATVQLACPRSAGGAQAIASRVGMPVAPDVGVRGPRGLFGDVLSAVRDTMRIASFDPRGVS